MKDYRYTTYACYLGYVVQADRSIMSGVMEKKAYQAAVCYEDLLKKLDIDTDTEVLFNLSETREKQIKNACYSHNPFPGVLKAVLLSLRNKAVKRLFEEEKVLQTGPAAAILALDAVQRRDMIWRSDGQRKRI